MTTLRPASAGPNCAATSPAVDDTLKISATSAALAPINRATIARLVGVPLAPGEVVAH
jgi:hypothetical protein